MIIVWNFARLVSEPWIIPLVGLIKLHNLVNADCGNKSDYVISCSHLIKSSPEEHKKANGLLNYSEMKIL